MRHFVFGFCWVLVFTVGWAIVLHLRANRRRNPFKEKGKPMR